MQKILHFIHAKKTSPLGGQFLENVNPATGQVFSFLARGSKQDVNAAVTSAHQAFASWSRTSAAERSKFLLKIADLIEARADEFARLESQDQGKPVHLAASMDISRAVLNFRFFAQVILAQEEESTTDAHTLNYVSRKPVGVAGLISPWNLPLYLLTWKIAPALACGNTVVCKPSEMTSMTADLLADVCVEAGLPAGVLNIVYGLGHEAGDALVRHPDVPLISFTGGTATGRKILEASAEHFKKVSLELGGKNPNIIFADADLKKALAMTLRSSFLNQGEICLCGSRIYVERSIYDSFVKQFVAETEKLTVGDPRSDKSFMGPLVSKAHWEKVRSYIDLAVSEGGRIEAGGTVPLMSGDLQQGFWLRPTVLSGLAQDSRCVQEEIFGPVVTIHAFDSIEEVVQKANDVKYGLSATVWTENLSKAQKMAGELRVGTVWINTWLHRDLRMPFGGMKHSGIGREGGIHSIDFFTETTTVCVRTS
ncbi:MAG: aldehyde dehydrogenase [Bdellovibrio sp.]|jgi:aminomuconate-semialdehyde/2-hydroxymuconate-6-semialdehyde dehydrogenase